MLNVIIYGINSIIIQTLLFREIISNFYSNEIFVSASVGIWIFISSTGAILTSRLKINIDKKIIKSYHFLTPLLATFSITIIKFLTFKLLPLGENIDYLYAFLISFLIILPYSLINGAYYISNSKITENGYIKTYYLEAFGYTLGGIIISILISIFKTDRFTIILFLTILNASYFYKTKKIIFYLILNLSALILSKNIYHISNLKTYTLFKSFDTKYSKVEVFSYENEILIKTNSQLYFSTIKDLSSEINILIPLSYLKQTKKAAVLSFDPKIAEKLIDEGFDEVYLIEKDKELIKSILNHYDLKEKNKIKIITDSPQIFFSNNKDFDLIITGQIYPDTLNSSAIITENFTNIIQNSLSENGVFVLYLPFPSYTTTLLTKNITDILGSTLKLKFKNIHIFKTDETIIVATKNKSQLNNKYSYLEYIFQTKEELKEIKKPNSKDKPIIFIYGNIYEISKFYPKLSEFIFKNFNKISITFLILILFIFLSIKKTDNYLSNLAFSSFTLLFIEITSIFIIQTNYGELYSNIQFIITLIMIGLSFGAYYGTTRNLILIYPLILTLLLSTENKYLIYLINFTAGFINGNTFSNTVKNLKIRTEKAYLYDMILAGLSSILSPFILIGFLGIKNSILFLILLTFINLRKLI